MNQVQVQLGELSCRESQVLNHILSGKSNKSIANVMHLSERTIKFHCSNIYRKLNVSSRQFLLAKMAQKLYLSTAE